jgi:hypothetical protein
MLMRSNSTFKAQGAIRSLLNFGSKRNFGSKIDDVLEKMISKLPNYNLGYFLAGMNVSIYFLYLIWPRERIYSFMNNFTFNR